MSHRPDRSGKVVTARQRGGQHREPPARPLTPIAAIVAVVSTVMLQADEVLPEFPPEAEVMNETTPPALLTASVPAEQRLTPAMRSRRGT